MWSWIKIYLTWLAPRRLEFDKTTVLQQHDPVLHKPAPAIRCGQCTHPITEARFAIEMAGLHQHHVTNPAGIEFTIVLFREAMCHRVGNATLADTWFPGYYWQLAVCPGCGQHLGWHYSQSQFHGFFGLIKPRLLFDGK